MGQVLTGNNHEDNLDSAKIPCEGHETHKDDQTTLSELETKKIQNSNSPAVTDDSSQSIPQGSSSCPENVLMSTSTHELSGKIVFVPDTSEAPQHTTLQGAEGPNSTGNSSPNKSHPNTLIEHPIQNKQHQLKVQKPPSKEFKHQKEPHDAKQPLGNKTSQVQPSTDKSHDASFGEQKPLDKDGRDKPPSGVKDGLSAFTEQQTKQLQEEVSVPLQKGHSGTESSNQTVLQTFTQQVAQPPNASLKSQNSKSATEEVQNGDGDTQIVDDPQNIEHNIIPVSGYSNSNQNSAGSDQPLQKHANSYKSPEEHGGNQGDDTELHPILADTNKNNSPDQDLKIGTGNESTESGTNNDNEQSENLDTSENMEQHKQNQSTSAVNKHLPGTNEDQESPQNGQEHKSDAKETPQATPESVTMLKTESLPGEHQSQSSQEKTENDTAILQSQIDRLSKEKDKLAKEVEELKLKEKKTQQHHEKLLAEKHQEVTAVNQQLQEKSEVICELNNKVMQLQQQVKQLHASQEEMIKETLDFKKREEQWSVEKDQWSTEKAEKDKQLQLRNKELAKREKQLVEKDEELYMKNKTIASKDKEISKNDKKLLQKDQEKGKIMSEKDKLLAKKEKEYFEVAQLLEQRDHEIKKMKEDNAMQLEETKLLKQRLLRKDIQLERINLEKSLKEQKILELQQKVAQLQSKLDEEATQRNEEVSLKTKHVAQQQQEYGKLLQKCHQLKAENYQHEREIFQLTKKMKSYGNNVLHTLHIICF